MARNQETIEQILQSCLIQIGGGQETVDSVVARYPEHAELLREQIETALWLQAHNDGLDPRPGFVSASRRRLVSQIKAEMAAPARPVSWLDAIKQHPFWQTWLQRAALPATLVLILLVMLYAGSSSVVLAAQGSLPGDALYPVKITLERLALAVSLDDANDAQLSLEFTERRSMEINRLIVEGRFEDINDSVDEFQSQVDQTIGALDVVAVRDDAEARDLAVSLRAVLNEQNEYFETLMDVAPNEEAKDSIEKAIRVSRRGAEEAEDLIDEQTTGDVAETEEATRPTRPVVLPPTETQRATPTSVPPRPTQAPTDEVKPPTPQPTVQSRPPQATKTSKPPATDPPPPTFTAVPTSTEWVMPTPAPTDTVAPTATSAPTATTPPTVAPTATPVPTEAPTATPPPTNTPWPTTQPQVTEITPADTPPTSTTDTPTPMDVPADQESSTVVVPDIHATPTP